jgi:hypothetical protein
VEVDEVVTVLLEEVELVELGEVLVEVLVEVVLVEVVELLVLVLVVLVVDETLVVEVGEEEVVVPGRVPLVLEFVAIFKQYYTRWTNK